MIHYMNGVQPAVGDDGQPIFIPEKQDISRNDDRFTLRNMYGLTSEPVCGVIDRIYRDRGDHEYCSIHLGTRWTADGGTKDQKNHLLARYDQSNVITANGGKATLFRGPEDLAGSDFKSVKAALGGVVDDPKNIMLFLLGLTSLSRGVNCNSGPWRILHMILGLSNMTLDNIIQLLGRCMGRYTAAVVRVLTQKSVLTAFNQSKQFVGEAIQHIIDGRDPTRSAFTRQVIPFLEYPNPLCASDFHVSRARAATKRRAAAEDAIAAAVPADQRAAVVAEFRNEAPPTREFAQRHRLPPAAVAAIEAASPDDDDEEAEPGQCKVCDANCRGDKCRPCVKFIAKTPAAVSDLFEPDDLDNAARAFFMHATRGRQQRNPTQFVKFLAERYPDMAIAPAAAPVARTPCLTCRHNTLKPGTDCAGCGKFWGFVRDGAPDQFNDAGDDGLVALRARLAEYLAAEGITLGAGATGKSKTAATKFVRFLNEGAAPMEIDLPVAAGPVNALAARVSNTMDPQSQLLILLHALVNGDTKKVVSKAEMRAVSAEMARLVDVTQNRNLLKRLVDKKFLAAPGAARKEGLYNITESGVEHVARMLA